MPKGKRMLSERQKAFVDAYVATLNASDAARKAGFSEKSARSQGSRLLAHPKVKAAIADALAQRAAAAGLRAEDVLARIKYIMNCEPSEKWRSADIVKVIELAGKFCKLWSDKVEVEVGVSLEQLIDEAISMGKREATAIAPEGPRLLPRARGSVRSAPQPGDDLAGMIDEALALERPAATATVPVPVARTETPAEERARLERQHQYEISLRSEHG
jgi:phage terminase small subunit